MSNLKQNNYLDRALEKPEIAVRCPSCSAAPGVHCLTKRGNVTSTAHSDRQSFYRKRLEYCLFMPPPAYTPQPTSHMFVLHAVFDHTDEFGEMRDVLNEAMETLRTIGAAAVIEAFPLKNSVEEAHEIMQLRAHLNKCKEWNR